MAAGGILLFEVLVDWRGSLGAGASARFMECLSGYDALLAVQIPLGATLSAFHPLSNLPKRMAWVPLMGCCEGLVDAGALDEVLLH